jgi:hypothetical protein
VTRILLAALALPAIVAAQELPTPATAAAPRGFAIGVTGFTGGNCQPSGVDLALLRPVGSPPGHGVMSLGVRLGSFVQDQAVLVGGSKGFFVTALLGVSRPIANLAMVGTEQDPNWVRLVAAPEVGVSAGADSPLPEGSYWGTGALLLGLSFGDDQRIDQNFAILAGPAVFAGKDGAHLHLQVTLRYHASSGGTGRRGSPD